MIEETMPTTYDKLEGKYNKLRAINAELLAALKGMRRAQLIHGFMPTEFGGDWCVRCGENFRSDTHLCATESEAVVKQQAMAALDAAIARAEGKE
jgi:hypothetical protein